MDFVFDSLEKAGTMPKASLDRLRQVDGLGPEAIVMSAAGKLARALVARQNVEVNVRIDHHQH